MAFYGDLDEISFAELLQLLNLGRKSGTLTVRLPQGLATVHLRDGEIVHATLGQAGGKEVIYRLLGASTGEFQFERSVAPVTRTIHDTTDSLVLEGMRRIDEWGQLEREFSDLNVLLRLCSSSADKYDGLDTESRTLLALVDATRDVATIIRESGIEPVRAMLLITDLIGQGLVERWQPTPVGTRDEVAHLTSPPSTLDRIGMDSYFSRGPGGRPGGRPGR